MYYEEGYGFSLFYLSLFSPPIFIAWLPFLSLPFYYCIALSEPIFS